MHDSPTKTIGVQHHQSVSRRVRPARKNMTATQLGSVIMDDGFGVITDFCSRRAWPELVRKHNDQTNDYHLSLYEDVVIGHDLIACRDIVLIDLSSVWMLANALRAIVAGWNFQLCGDVTGNFCSRSVDLLEIFAEGASISSIQLQPSHARTMSVACP
jgi:hypothetical protein